MRRVRTTVALACAAGALLVGIAPPAHAARAEDPATAVATAAYQFGVYYTLEACRYFGDSLVAGGAWDSYNCQYQWNATDQQGYWHLYVW